MKNTNLGKYGLPLNVVYCSNCTRSNQRPHNLGEFIQKKNEKKKYVEIKKNNICQACQFYFYKDKINWSEREEELKNLCDKYRKNNGEYDVIIPGSGGKDSIYVAHQLKHIYKMNPLLITWSPNLLTEIGKKNFEAFINLGMPNVMYYQNQKIHRLLTKLAFLHLVHPFQPFILGQKNLAPKLAIKYNIKFVMFGEHDAEFGMNMDQKDIPTMKKEFYSSSKNVNDLYISGIKVSDLKKEFSLTDNDLEPYYPINNSEFDKSKIEFHFFSYYKKWNFHDNYYYAIQNSSFKPSDTSLEGSYDKYASMDDKIDWLHFYTFYIKFGMGRATAATDQEIRSGIIDRDEGISLVKRFDHIFPKNYINDCLRYMEIDMKTFSDIIEKSRPDHLWKKTYGKWKLKTPIWKYNEKNKH